MGQAKMCLAKILSTASLRTKVVEDGSRIQMTTSAIYYLGKPFVYPTDSIIGRFLERGRGWDSVLQPILKALLPEEEHPVICEVGSNIGASLMQILAAKPEARVLAFEPSDRFRPYLLRNLDLAGVADRVKVYPWGWEESRG